VSSDHTDVTPPRDRPATLTASTGTLARATLAAFALAVVVLVSVVLPAEYGIDPLGTGARFGLLALAAVPADPGSAAVAAPMRTGAVTAETQPYSSETIELTLAPYESFEYKYRLPQGASLLFSWRTTVKLDYDFHGEPDGATPGYAESYDKQTSDHVQGTFTAPFPGLHGWWWENPGETPLTLTLTTAGYYQSSHEFRFRKAPIVKTFGATVATSATTP